MFQTIFDNVFNGILRFVSEDEIRRIIMLLRVCKTRKEKEETAGIRRFNFEISIQKLQMGHVSVTNLQFLKTFDTTLLQVSHIKVRDKIVNPK